MFTEYSAEHIAAFRRYSFDGAAKLTEHEVTAIEREDPVLGQQVRAERAALAARKAAKQAAAKPAAPPPPAAVSHGFFDRFIAKYSESVANGVREYFAKQIAERDARIEALERRLTDLEVRGPGVSYAGVYKPDKQYASGSLVTAKGSLWLAVCDVQGTAPGTAPGLWKLIVKNGNAPSEYR